MSRADLPPTPAELAAWVRVASPRTARGTYIWRPSDQPRTFRYATVGGPPLVTTAPANVELRFRYAAPDSWQIDGPDGWSLRSHAGSAVVLDGSRERHGFPPLVFGGPDELLHPSFGTPPVEERLHEPSEVTAATLLGRACWRWVRPDLTLWIDDTSGCLLRSRGPEGERTFESLELDLDVSATEFDAPDADAWFRDEEPMWAGDTAEAAGQPPQPFRVPWWPLGTAAHPVTGDPSIPELLVELQTALEPAPTVYVGVAPAGCRAPTAPGSRRHRWQTASTSFALSWRGALTPGEIEQLVGSMPEQWA